MCEVLLLRSLSWRLPFILLRVPHHQLCRGCVLFLRLVDAILSL